MRAIEPESKPILQLHRFNIYKQDKNPFLEPEKQIRNLNFIICGDENEFLSVRVYLDEEIKVDNVRCFYCQGFDSELADYLTKGLIQWLNKKYSNSRNIKYKQITLWKKEK